MNQRAAADGIEASGFFIARVDTSPSEFITCGFTSEYLNLLEAVQNVVHLAARNKNT
jgi:hypothetical protein